jgi:ArsR family transcriptional regulator
MAFSKSVEFSKKEQELASLAKALSHPARIQILKILAKRNECICGDIVEVLPLAQSTVSQHLKELLNVGLIQGTIDGPRSCYCINPKGIAKVNAMFNELFTNVETACDQNNCC